MDGRRKPDPKPENEKEHIDEEIIDLSQVIEGGDDDDIIDLNNVLEQPEPASDEVVIPLVDTIPTEETAALPQAPEDDIIDLEDVAATLEANLAETETKFPELPADDDVPETEADDEILDLLDVNTLGTPEADVLEPLSADDDREAALPEAPEDDIIDLEDVATALEAGLAETEAEIPEMSTDEEAPVAEADESGIVDLATADEAEPTAAVLSAAVLPLGAPISDPVPLTEQQVEDALERVIEKIYSEKIEQLMIQSIDKTVKREIEKYKMALLEDSDDRIG